MSYLLSINGKNVQNNQALPPKFASGVNKADKKELSKLLNGQDWQQFDENKNGVLESSEVDAAIMTIASELEEGNNYLDDGEDFYSETSTEDGGFIATTMTRDGVKTESYYDKNGRLIKEVITENGQTRVSIPKYNSETGMVE